MPSVLTHFALLDRIHNSSAGPAKQLIEGNWTAAYWGSVGPDYLFFAPSDWAGLDQFFRFIYEIQDALKEAAELYTKIDSFVGEAKDFITGGLSSEIETTAQYLESTLITHLAAAISDKFDLFSLVVSPTQKYQPVEDWWWMDIGHNLLTAKHAQALWQNSATDPMARAYAYGYLSHVAGDVVVHPYVNLIAGGPYRLHPRRHVLIEKAFDSYLLDKWYGARVADCGWHTKILFDEDAVFPDLPQNLINLIHKSLLQTYGSLGIKSGVPGPDDINLMYRFFFKTLKGSTSIGWLTLPPPSFKLIDMPDEIKDVFAQSPPSVPLPANLSSASDWRKFLLALFEFLKYLFKTLLKLLALAYSVIIQLATAQFRFLLWLIQKLLYEIYLNAQFMLALGGFLHPTTRHLPFFAPLNNPSVSKYFEYDYPFKKYWNDEQTYHLVFPADVGKPLEPPAAFPFARYLGPLNGVTTPAPFFDVEAPLIGDAPNPAQDLLSICNYPDPAALQNFFSEGNGFRSASTLALQLFSQFEKNGGIDVPNYNLDGDRGYGWPTWDYIAPQPWSNASFTFHCK